MAAALDREFGSMIKLALRTGSGGIFDVIANGHVVFSAHAMGRFPTDEEIVDAVASRKKG